jgi:hypothetical protein
MQQKFDDFNSETPTSSHIIASFEITEEPWIRHRQYPSHSDSQIQALLPTKEHKYGHISANKNFLVVL